MLFYSLKSKLLLEKIETNDISHQNFRSIKRIELLTSIWIFHGALDGAVYPVLSHNMLKALKDAGAHPGYTQYPKVGHFSWIAVYDDDMIMDWLFSQNKYIWAFI